MQMLFLLHILIEIFYFLYGFFPRRPRCWRPRGLSHVSVIQILQSSAMPSQVTYLAWGRVSSYTFHTWHKSPGPGHCRTGHHIDFSSSPQPSSALAAVRGWQFTSPQSDTTANGSQRTRYRKQYSPRALRPLAPWIIFSLHATIAPDGAKIMHPARLLLDCSESLTKSVIFVHHTLGLQITVNVLVWLSRTNWSRRCL